MSQRVAEALQARRGTKEEGWVFPSDSESGHLTKVAKTFQKARKDAGLPKGIVLYRGRHTFGTKLLANTVNISLVMRAMAHSSVPTATIYQHPDLEMVRTVMNGGQTGKPLTSQSTSHSCDGIGGNGS